MASSSTVTSTTRRNPFTVIANPKLIPLISSVKQLSLITTDVEVLEGLRMYILKKKLYNPLDPVKICCTGDELSTILGTENFTIQEIHGKLLRKLIHPVCINLNNSGTMQATNAVSDVAGKRKTEESEGGGAVKKSCNEAQRDPMYLFIPPSPRKEYYSSDTADSIQGYETAFVKDSGDDSSCFPESEDDLHPGDIFAVEETFDVEYEIESDSENDIKVSVSDSGSDSENVVDTVLSFVCKSDSDEEFWADKSSDENFDSDLEIPVSDKWECKKCGSLNNPPMRNCYKCWCMRSGWIVPKRSERRTRRKPRSKRNKKLNSTLNNFREESCSPKPSTSSSSGSALDVPNSELSHNTNKKAPKLNSICSHLTPDTSSDISSTDLPTKSLESFQEYTCSTSYFQKLPNSFSDISSSSQELSTLSSYSSSQEFPSSYSCSQELPSTSSFMSEMSNSSKDVISSLNDFKTLNLSTVPKCEADAKLCLLCCTRSANASIIHGKYAHQISCYRCARKLQLENKRCPVCRRTIDRVVYQISAL